MCTEPDSLPPVPVIAGAAVDHDDLVLEAEDGNHLAAFVARPSDPASVGIVICPDVRGLAHFYEELALRFAERGYAAVAIDYYGRVAGAEKRSEDFPAMEFRSHLDVDAAKLDIAAAIDFIHGQGVESVFTLGCCFGATVAWLATTGDRQLAGAIGYHGGLGDRGDKPGPTRSAGEMKAPILALQGGADEHITAADNAAFDAALSAAGVEHEVVIEPGAPHSFFDRRFEEYADQSADAWRRTLEFIERHSRVTA
ncbi:MAG: dienelactone hydrolase family protein [Solirubrobacteraceae bacterium]|jgi:carboxymethylenebutenolidase